ncbi:GNAT family N-acetyltransferase [Lutispora saccharofermentans]|uniref:N-acetyltransferase n=1 Tax=Lutispora saccharofermentans TaxID=3024236 RepID=A0ABT1NGJ3_9FIRM|nr:N-acetyltransferase [Lutispora saccharofermentans]MCQ1530393.1 N-acetyltransferase [Lutispora saccharofermentans]
MNIKIRSERVADYNGIANVNYEAFLGWHPDNQYVSESIMVDLLRHNSLFDPDLSLVAETGGQIVGYALFSPFKFIVLGAEQLGVVLAPVAVKPEFQNRGIGGMLIEEGHKRAESKGFSFSLLCGHPSYYPRFGYKTRMFSLSGAKVMVDAMSFNGDSFHERPVSLKDLSRVMECWKDIHDHDGLALFPGTSISEWSNHGLQCRCTMVLKNDRVLGYARYVKTNVLSIKELLAKTEDAADLLSYLAWKNYGSKQGEIHIPLSAEKMNSLINVNDFFNALDERNNHEAFMIKVLKEKSSIAGYCEQVEKGEIQPGIIAFPPMFDVDDGRVE